jgi:CRISPR-associated endonuclease/helicase Cas3
MDRSEASEATKHRAVQAVERLTAHRPYRWQERLLCERLLEGRLPDAVDVPTGLGKTRVMALWLVARALGASLPRRLIYVVDRRAVVDQATEEAEGLAARLPAVLAELGDEADQWRERLGLRDDCLPISTLRGQLADNRHWLETPAGAAIVVGTVDMVGSRLLFEGYGVSSGMRPAHAALLGNDALIVIDEAHLVPPFKALLRSAASFERPDPIPRMHVLSLSATGAPDPSEDVFGLEPEDLEDPPVRARLNAPKRLRLQQVDDIVKGLADRAFDFGEDGANVIVFCNSRDKLAREVEKTLRERSEKVWKGVQTTALLVGARRVLERDLLTGRRRGGRWEIEPDPVFRRFMPGEAREITDIPAFLVATSAGEVGVDLDADHMVCDLVAWERMVQRLGRVNRTGRLQAAMVDVFLAKSLKDDAEDEVEDDRLMVLRGPFENPAWTEGDDGRRAGGPGALLALKAAPMFVDAASAATTPEPLRPALTSPLLEAWAMTSLDQHPGRPDVAPWLRGWIETRPQTRVVWRRVLPVRFADGPATDLLAAFFAELPPHLSEVLEAETFQVAAALKARATAIRKQREVDKGLAALAVVRLSPQNRPKETLTLKLEALAEMDPKRLFAWLAGQTVVVDVRLGGLSAHGLLDPREDSAPPSLDAEAPALAGAPGWSEALLQNVGRRLVEPDTSLPEAWVRQAGWPMTTGDGGDEPPKEWRIDRLATAPTVGDAARASRAQGLKDHHDWTEREARAIGSALALSAEHRGMLEIAARVHDAGKARDLWQTAMGAAKADRPLAKTDGRRANPILLQGYRHEFGSLRDAEADLANIEDDDLRDLARHLILAHHGWARPVIKPIDPDEPPSASEARARDAALRFARLQRKWGPWGLAWWETLLRAADWAASRKLAEPERR